ncbi:MAG: SRPBCC domain-containing protein [Burkholderiales bacterium]
MAATTADADPALAPIELDLVVPCDPGRAFDYFTRDIGRWWPLGVYSCSENAAASVAFEPDVGGGLIETEPGGRRHRWGTVGAWERGSRLAFTWHPGRDDSDALWIEVSFREDAGGTRVTLRHGGWERLAERAVAAREAYRNGWPTVFGRLYRDWCVASAGEAR